MSIDPLWIFTGFLVFIRAGTFIILVPMFGSHLIPVRVRVLFAAMLAILVAGLIGPLTWTPTSWLQLAVAGTQEAAVGGLMGLAIRLIFATVELGGHYIATELGLMMAQAFNPLEQIQSSLVEMMLFYFALLIFFVTGLHHNALAGFVRSFDILPVGSGFAGAAGFPELIRQSGGIFVSAVQVAAPFVAVIFLVNLSFAVLGKIAPNVNVFLVSFAVRIAVGLIILLISIGVITQVFLTQGQQGPENMLRLIVP